MRKDELIVRDLNSCLDLKRLKELWSNDEWNRFIELLDGGHLHFSGEPSGFHIKISPNSVRDCASPETNQRGENGEGHF
jgi:hypothetical protein